MPQECAYCPNPATTKDHVPPKGFFAKPLPDNLITVPCCEDCNSDASLDDEYVRLILAMRYDVYEHPDVEQVLGRAIRSLARPEAAGFRNAFVKTVREVELRTAAGLILGKTGKFDADLSRLNRVFSRVLKGLYFKQKGKRVPASCEVSVIVLDSVDDRDGQILLELQRTIAFLNDVPETVVGRDVFRYRLKFVHDEPDSGIALITLYSTVHMLGYIINRIPEKDQEA